MTTNRTASKSRQELRTFGKFVPAREVVGRNDAGNAPCPDCVCLLAQIGVTCNRHQEVSSAGYDPPEFPAYHDAQGNEHGEF